MKIPAQRLLWIPVLALILIVIPELDSQRGPELLREKTVVDGLFGAWAEGISVALAPAVSYGQRLRSFFEGDDALPKAEPFEPFALPVSRVDDASGATPAWTIGDLAGQKMFREGPLRIVEVPPGTPNAFELSMTQNAGVVTATLVQRGDGDVLTLTTTDARRKILQDTFPGGERARRAEVTRAAGRGSLLPPLVAIFVALITRRALLSLVCGVLAGAGVMALGNSVGIAAAASDTGLLKTAFDLYWGKLTDSFSLTIVLFILFLIGMVGVITRTGGTQGLVDLLTRRSKGLRSTRVVTALMGFIVFFDDYTNTVIVGSTMRPLTDKMRIAREKLAYLIDSTAAPVAGIALFSTWIGYEIGQYQAALDAIGAPDGAYGIFIRTIPMRFYCMFTLVFVLANVILGRDFGPMLKAEHRTQKTGKVIADTATPLTSRRFAELATEPGVEPRAMRAVVPIVVVVLTMLVGFWFVGGGLPKFRAEGWASFQNGGIGDILNNDYNMNVAVIAALVGSVIAIASALRSIGFWRAVRSWFVGSSSLLLALAILVSAWALAEACKQLNASIYLVGTLGDAIPLVYQPLALFCLACVIAFATGTSWGTMAILLPISIPMVYATALADGVEPMGLVTLMSFGAVLEGSIFGDHCSPISDTTVLSSVAAGSDHIDHVKTQIPYALTTMAIAIVCGYLPVAWGWYGASMALVVGAGACVGVLVVFGQPTDLPDVAEVAEGAAPELVERPVS